MTFYHKSTIETLARLESSDSGLTSGEVEKRRARYGLNTLETRTRFNPFLIFLSQFKSFIIYILLFAVAISIVIGEYLDSAIILIILLANAVIGFFQELGAHKSLEALKKISATYARVLRDGNLTKLDAKYLVPGDVIILESGDKVPADSRILRGVRLIVEEAPLTGESVAVEKNPEIITNKVQIGDQKNMLFASTSVVNGTGKAVVTATGMHSEIGKITQLLKETKEEMTPLQRRLNNFGKKLGYVIIAICILVFLLSFGKEYLANGVSAQTFITFSFFAISLAVAAVPTALPAVVTIALSVGVKRLLNKKALVRRLSSVETLGSCNVICTDKTGTLTENQMTVRKAWTLDGETEVGGSGYTPEGLLTHPIDPLLFQIGLACNNASLAKKGAVWEITGDPTEAALLVSAKKAGVGDLFDRMDEIPFDSERKLMSVLVRNKAGFRMFTKGAPDQVLRQANFALADNEIITLTDAIKQKIVDCNDHYASRAMRVLAFACKDLKDQTEFIEQDLVFVGLQAMIDPPRIDVIEAIKTTKQAGIRTIMITGDYKETAKAIANEIDIQGNILSGSELDAMTDDQLAEALQENTNIFARVVPAHKQRIVSALQKLGHTVAMTGDGVNDAPALKKANIGIAVGSGTDVAKEAADFVLLDDSFTHIVNAVEEGRGLYDNIQKSIMLLLSGNLGEVLIVFFAIILGLNLPLTAILLLWINMVTDGAPALAYSVDPYDPHIMTRKPRDPKEGILPRPHLMLLGALGVAATIIALVLFGLYGGGSSNEKDIILGQTMVFNFVVFYEGILIFIIRRGYRVKLFTNKWIWFSTALFIVLQIMLMYTPLHVYFKITPLGSDEITVLMAAGIIFFGSYLFYQNFVARFIFGKTTFIETFEKTP